MGPADAATQHDSSAASIAPDPPESPSRDSVAALIESGQYAQCLRLLDKPGQHAMNSKLRTLRLICQTCLRSQDGQWWQVNASEKNLARQYQSQGALPVSANTLDLNK